MIYNTTMNMQTTNVKWPTLIKTLREDKCILCIGPGVFTDEDGNFLDKQILDYLKADGELDQDIVVYPDGLFYFKDKSKQDHIIADLEHFYSKPFKNVEELFKKLVQIPFNLVVFLTPDKLFFDTAIAEKRPFIRDFYFKGNPPRETFKPTKEKPMVYHLLGALNAEADESVILTYDDLFDFLKSTFEGASMSNELKTTIQEARHFICLGLSLDKWYMQLLLRVLNLHVNEKSTKYALLSGQYVDAFDVYKDQFKLTIIPTNSNNFIDELLDKCLLEDLIRTEKGQSKNYDSPKSNIYTLISEDRIDDTFDYIERYLVEQKKWEIYSGDFALLRGQYKMLKNHIIKNVISNDGSARNLAKIREAILEFSNEALK